MPKNVFYNSSSYSKHCPFNKGYIVRDAYTQQHCNCPLLDLKFSKGSRVAVWLKVSIWYTKAKKMNIQGSKYKK